MVLLALIHNYKLNVQQTGKVWIFILFFSLSLQAQALENHTRFRTLNTEDGLSSHNISSITQDGFGYLWVGSDDGLNRYDGVGFKVFRNEPGDTTTLSDSRVTAILPAEYHGEQVLWVGTRNGLNRIDLTTGISKMYLHDPDDEHSLGHPIVTALALDSDGLLWVGTEGGLSILSPGGQSVGWFRRIQLAQNKGYEDAENLIRSLAIGPGHGSNRNIWVGTGHGLKHLQNDYNNEYSVRSYDFSLGGQTPFENEIRALKVMENKGHVLLYIGTDTGALYALDLLNPRRAPQHVKDFYTSIRDIQIDLYGQVWIASYGAGLIRMRDIEGKQQITKFIGSPELRNSLSNSHTGDLFRDRSGVLWVATDNGLNAVLDPNLGFKTLKHIAGEPNSLIGSEIRSVFEDSEGDLWVGTVANGLTRIRSPQQNYEHFVHDPDDPQSLSSNSITSILEDEVGNHWFGTWGGGLLRLTPDGKSFQVYQHEPNNENSPPDNVIQGLLDDRQGNLWLNTGNGLSRFNHDEGHFYNYAHDPLDSASLSGGDLQSKAMYLDRKNRLWVGSYGGGLNRLNLNEPRNLVPETAQFEHFHEAGKPANRLSNDMIISLLGTWDGEQETLWAGTFNGGLNRIVLSAGPAGEIRHVKHYTEDHGLCDNVIFGIEEDERQMLWLSTGGGLSHFDPLSETFINYYIEDGLPSNSFFWGASHKSKRGEMFFGGTDGLLRFNPHFISDPRLSAPEISITGLRTVEGSVSDRPEDFNQTTHFFRYDLVPITIEWALFDFTKPQKNTYQYKVDEFHDDWIGVGNSTSATFSNFTGGDYTFRVRGWNYNGVAAKDEAVVHIHIKPPIHRTLLFKILLVVLFGLLVYAFVAFRTYAIADANKQLRFMNKELKLVIEEKEKAEAVISAALNEKEVLLREIYHRTKNNMSVILSLLDLQAAKLNDKRIHAIFDEVKGRIFAMSLVHEQLMQSQDLSAINLNSYIQRLTSNLFAGFGNETSRIQSIMSVEPIAVSIDVAVPLGLVLNEIITNALKYAFPGNRKGELKIEARMYENRLHLKVGDNGVGFVEAPDGKAEKSLGLNIIHTIVTDQLEGTLEVNHDLGTTYTITLGEVQIVRRV